MKTLHPQKCIGRAAALWRVGSNLTKGLFWAMIKTFMIKHKTKIIAKIRAVTLVAVAVFLAMATPLASVQADTFDEQIRALRAEVEQFQARAGELRQKANTLQDEINVLNAEKSRLQTQIQLNEARLEQLKAEIQETEQRIENQKELMGSSLRESYLESSVSPLEMLASSNSISDFIDKQEYRNNIQESIRLALIQIRELKDDLNKQRADVEKTLADQKVQRNDLAAKEAEQANLLAQTQGEEGAYQQMSQEHNARITELQAEQARLNAQLIGGGGVQVGPACGGGYSGGWPWCNAPMNAYVDNWGMFSRQCVSYTAYKVAASGRHMPYWGGIGNANQWPGNARDADIPVDGNPRSGDVAVWSGGEFGHTMYVEHVYGNGDIFISEYNFDWTGRHSERVIAKAVWQSQQFEFIHF